MRESLSNIDSAINTAYTGAVTEAPLSKYTQEITKREIEKESKRIEQYSTKMVVSGEAAPDLLIGEIFSGLKSSGDKDAWRFLSTIPFVIDTVFSQYNTDFKIITDEKYGYRLLTKFKDNWVDLYAFNLTAEEVAHIELCIVIIRQAADELLHEITQISDMLDLV